MVTRIVKLTFQEEKVQDFLSFFEMIKLKVNSFPGCLGMQLMQDSKNPCVIFTYSQWESEENLNNYRDSGTFGEVWPSIKPWFGDKPEAWTTNVVFNGFEN
ncbi:MAG: antibiotic biosynthesis monooxygenase [Crocinitomicaceae bacterium]